MIGDIYFDTYETGVSLNNFFINYRYIDDALMVIFINLLNNNNFNNYLNSLCLKRGPSSPKQVNYLDVTTDIIDKGELVEVLMVTEMVLSSIELKCFILFTIYFNIS